MKNRSLNRACKIAFAFLFMWQFTSLVRGQEKKPVNVIVFGAHPDDCDEVAGGTAAKWVAAGCRVRFVSVTNGDAGHQSEGGGALARRRRAEALESGRRAGVDYVVLDNHDGELMPTLQVREQIIRQIRQWNADLVLGPRPNDYHPDHRYTGTLVLDAAYMVTVPRILPKVPHLEKNPVFLYMSDGFVHPEPFKPDVCVIIDDVIEKKIDMYHQHTSQMYEWLPYNRGGLSEVPATEAERREWLGKTRKSSSNAGAYREKLTELYGEEKASAARYCEAFQDSGYGTRLTKDNIKKYFPFIGN